jgi:hypothetical protein
MFLKVFISLVVLTLNFLSTAISRWIGI